IRVFVCGPRTEVMFGEIAEAWRRVVAIGSRPQRDSYLPQCLSLKGIRSCPCPGRFSDPRATNPKVVPPNVSAFEDCHLGFLVRHPAVQLFLFLPRPFLKNLFFYASKRVTSFAVHSRYDFLPT